VDRNLWTTSAIRWRISNQQSCQLANKMRNFYRETVNSGVISVNPFGTRSSTSLLVLYFFLFSPSSLPYPCLPYFSIRFFPAVFPLLHFLLPLLPSPTLPGPFLLFILSSPPLLTLLFLTIPFLLSPFFCPFPFLSPFFSSR